MVCMWFVCGNVDVFPKKETIQVKHIGSKLGT